MCVRFCSVNVDFLDLVSALTLKAGDADYVGGWRTAHRAHLYDHCLV